MRTGGASGKGRNHRDQKENTDRSPSMLGSQNHAERSARYVAKNMGKTDRRLEMGKFCNGNGRNSKIKRKALWILIRQLMQTKGKKIF